MAKCRKKTCKERVLGLVFWLCISRESNNFVLGEEYGRFDR